MSLRSFLKWLYPILFLIRHWRFIFGAAALCLASIIVFVYFYIFRGLPSPSVLATQNLPLTTHIRDRNGKELYKVYASQNRTLVKLSDLPAIVPQATVSIEDKDFYHHSGFSVSGFMRAAWRIITNSRLEGGSTITQQLVKTSLLTSERTVRRKLKELVLSIAVESLYSKDQILEMYLNRVPFGGTAYGIEEAAQTYFGKPAKELSVSEAALLAGLPASPTTFSPYGSHPELAKSRQKEVLKRLVEDNRLTWDQAEHAAAEELHYRLPESNIAAPHFVMYVKELLAKKYGEESVEQGGLDVVTTLDLDLQNQAQAAVSDEVAKINYLHVTNGAAVVTRPATGEILAMVGSVNYFDIAHDGNVNVALALRQPGSSIKPINYALALSKNYSPASYIDDSPITYRIAGAPDYTPVNYDGRFHGRVTLRQALANSYNIPAVKLLSANGVSNMVDLAQKMGISTWADSSQFGLSLTLGAGEVTMVDMATVYGVFANGGRKIPLTPFLSVRDSSGKVLEQLSPTYQPVFDPRIAYQISSILSDNAARTPTFGSRSDLYFPNTEVAVKTGTTNSMRDNWTIGYTTNLLAAVWVGNNDNTPMSYIASGITGASPIWKHIMSDLLKGQSSHIFATPSGLIRSQSCTGQLDYFIPGTQPVCIFPSGTPMVINPNNPVPTPQVLPAITYPPYQPPVYPTVKLLHTPRKKR